MEHAPRAGPGRVRRWVALATALAVGGAGVPLTVFVVATANPSHEVIGLILLVVGVGGAALAGLALRERLLQVEGGPPAVLRSPRGIRGVLAFAAGYVVGVGPTLAQVFLSLDFLRGTIGWPVVLYSAVSPTLGLIVTRALCRRWGTPRPPASPAPATSPAPVVDPAADRPGPSLLPASA